MGSKGSEIKGITQKAGIGHCRSRDRTLKVHKRENFFGFDFEIFKY
jgi:hypothetical protein